MKENYWGTLVPRINVENACIQQISFYVFPYIHAVFRHVTLFVWVHCHNYLLLTSSFFCALSYMQHDYYQRTSYQCVTSYAGSLAMVLRCVRLYVRWYGSCISPSKVSEHLVPWSHYSVLPNYFYGDAIFSRCVAVITAWSCIVLDFTKKRNAHLRLVSPWKRVYFCHNNACWEPLCRWNFLLQCGRFPQVLRCHGFIYLHPRIITFWTLKKHQVGLCSAQSFDFDSCGTPLEPWLKHRSSWRRLRRL
jgi:hypothetical protein